VSASLRLELFAADVERLAAFYEDVLGFTRDAESEDYVALRRGTALIGIGRMNDLPDSHPLRTRSDQRIGAGVEIVIEVDDVEAAYRAVVESGWPVLAPLKARPWGLRDFRLLDPDGYYVRVTSRA
jgi:predicted enzyme related to lactoylglutathione lyase